MVIRIRLQRWGLKNKTSYRMVAAEVKARRQFLEILGHYYPYPCEDGSKKLGINFERTKAWLAEGAEPSFPVKWLLFRAGLLPPPPTHVLTRKGGREQWPRDPLTGAKIRPPDFRGFDSEGFHRGPKPGREPWHRDPLTNAKYRPSDYKGPVFQGFSIRRNPGGDESPYDPVTGKRIRLVPRSRFWEQGFWDKKGFSKGSRAGRDGWPIDPITGAKMCPPDYKEMEDYDNDGDDEDDDDDLGDE